MFKRPMTAAGALLALALISHQATTQTRELGASGELLDGIAAIVDSGVVLRSELDASVRFYESYLRDQQAALPPNQRPPLPPLSEIERQALEQLIVRQVQMQRASRSGIVIDDAMLNQAIAQIAARLDLTLDELPAALAAEGIDYAAYRQELREELTIEQLEQNEVFGRISISPRELEQCLVRLEAAQSGQFDYLVSHILVGLSASADQDEISAARELARDIVAQLNDGEDFARLAVSHSDGQTALEGGSLGWRQGAQLPTVFADQVLRMRPGEVSEPIQAASGFHIVKLVDMRGADPIMVDQARIRHILIRPDELFDDDAVRQRLIGIRDQLLAGDEFGPVAQATSEDTMSAADGGSLGWVSPGEMVPEFEQIVAALPLGEISEPFESRYGWHIAQVTERRSHDSTDEMKRQQCLTQIRNAKADEERDLWVRRLRDQAFVDVKL